jgi:hypothetical protein
LHFLPLRFCCFIFFILRLRYFLPFFFHSTSSLYNYTTSLITNNFLCTHVFIIHLEQQLHMVTILLGSQWTCGPRNVF